MSGLTERMPAVILAGGLATRLRPLTEKVPKSLIDVAGRPFLWHQLDLLRRHGVLRAIILAGHLGELIQDTFLDGTETGMRLDYSFDGPSLLGTGGAIRKALALLPERFFVLYGDSYLTCDFEAVEAAFLRSELPALMTVYRNEGRYDTSNVEYDGKRILSYDKVNRTPSMHHIDYGLGAFNRSVFQRLPKDRSFDLAAVYQQLLSDGGLAAFEVSERFYEIGTPQGLRDAEAYLKRAQDPGPLRRAVFLDRDGVLNEPEVREGKPYPPRHPADLRVYPGTADSLVRLKEQGFVLLVVSNQPDVARATQTSEVVEEINRRLSASLPLDGIYTCFHDDGDACGCRKPRPGLLVTAARDHAINLRSSYMVGDRWRDIEAGASSGCKTVWIDRGYRERAAESSPNIRVGSLQEAVAWILRDST